MKWKWSPCGYTTPCSVHLVILLGSKTEPSDSTWRSESGVCCNSSWRLSRLRPSVVTVGWVRGVESAGVTGAGIGWFGLTGAVSWIEGGNTGFTSFFPPLPFRIDKAAANSPADKALFGIKWECPPWGTIKPSPVSEITSPGWKT